MGTPWAAFCNLSAARPSRRRACGLVWCAPHDGDHSPDRGSARPLAGRVCAHPQGAGARSEHRRAGRLLSHVERALLVQVEPSLAPTPPHEGSAGAAGSRRERRRDRCRWRPGRRVQDGEPQPSELHRAVPGRRNGSRRHPPRRVHHGSAADRLDERAAIRRTIPATSSRTRAPQRESAASSATCSPWERGRSPR